MKKLLSLFIILFFITSCEKNKENKVRTSVPLEVINTPDSLAQRVLMYEYKEDIYIKVNENIYYKFNDSIAIEDTIALISSIFCLFLVLIVSLFSNIS